MCFNPSKGNVLTCTDDFTKKVCVKSSIEYNNCIEFTCNINVLYTNIDCLTNEKSEELKQLIVIEKIDLIALTEVNLKLQSNILPVDVFKIEGFTSYSTNKDGRGIIIYLKSKIQVKQIECTIDFKEALWIQIELLGDKPIIFGCMYRSPNSSNENFENMIKMIKMITINKNRNTVIVGDFNLRNINWESLSTTCNENRMEYKFLECLRDTYMYQLVRQPTTFRENNKPSILDLVLSTNEDNLSEINYLPSLGKSDHLVLTFNIHSLPLFNRSSQTIMNYNRTNWTDVNKEISKIEWEEIGNMDIQTAWTDFEIKILNIKEKSIPKYKKSPGGRDIQVDKETLLAIKD